MPADEPENKPETIEISKDFGLPDYPVGGYLAALAADLLSKNSWPSDLLTLQTSLFQHPEPGPAEALIETLYRSYGQPVVRKSLQLTQDGGRMAFFVAALTDFSRRAGLTQSFADAAPPRTPHADCVAVTTPGQPGVLSRHPPCFDIRLAPGCLTQPGPGPTGGG